MHLPTVDKQIARVVSEAFCLVSQIHWLGARGLLHRRRIHEQYIADLFEPHQSFTANPSRNL